LRIRWLDRAIAAARNFFASAEIFSSSSISLATLRLQTALEIQSERRWCSARFPRPRDLDSPGYLEKRDRIFRVMGMSLRVGDTAAA
jgi:hypothetical protein